MAKRTTVIIPAAGKSTRFPDMRPKWLLTHPSGKLMLELAVNPFIDMDYDLVMATTKEFSDKYEVPTVLQQLFGNRIRLIEIPYQTSGPVETISYTINAVGLTDDPIIVKDVDNYIDISKEKLVYDNFCIGVDVSEIQVDRLVNKSFILADSNGIVQDLIEKKIVSNIICVGVYGFASANIFLQQAEKLKAAGHEGEMFVSHLISSLIFDKTIYVYLKAEKYKDWGTMHEWTREANSFQSLFCDFDGVLVKNKGKFGTNNWFNHQDEPILENLKQLIDLQKNGATVIITTARPISEENYIREFLQNQGLEKIQIVCGLPHSRRLVINDFSNTNPYPSAIAINIERNGLLKNILTHNI